MAWFFFIAPVGTIIVQNLCLAISIYLDARSDPIFPRWVAHFNIVIAALLIPSAFSILHKSGPLAWNGAVSFTLRLSVFAIYIVVMFGVLLGVVNRQGSEREALACANGLVPPSCAGSGADTILSTASPTTLT